MTFQKAKLGSHVSQIRGLSYKPDEIAKDRLENYDPILKANNITENGLEEKDMIYIHKSRIRPEQYIRKGDILIAASSGSKDIVGKNIVFDEDYIGTFGAFCKVVRPSREIYYAYLSHFFKTPTYKRHIRKFIQGANINNLRNEHIDDLRILLPLYPDQIRIATVLSKAEALISQRKESLRLLGELLKSTFLEMFGDENKIENNKYKVDDLKLDEPGTFSNGPFGSDLLTSELTDRGVSVIYIRDIRNGYFEWKSKVCVTQQKADTLPNCSVRGDDVLIAKVGDPPGIAAVYPTGLPDSIISQDTIRIRLNINLALPQYLRFYLNSEIGKREIKKISIEGTRNRFPLGDFKKMSIPVPSIDLQTQFAQIVGKVEALKDHYQASLKEMENLYGSLSQRAFKGELDLSGMEVHVLKDKSKEKVKTK
jgi:type I restriction enzyme, S subunit